MNLQNETRLKAACTMGLDPDGREHLVAVAKGTFDLPVGGMEAMLAEEQLDLTVADEFAGEPGLSPVLRESDYAPTKPRCDVLFNGCAYAPGGRPAPAVRVCLEVVGLMKKTLDVHGTRVWTRALGAIPSRPLPFDRKPFDYGSAYGGIDRHPEHPDQVAVYYANPVGIGYYPLTKGKHLNGKPLPVTSAPGETPDSPKGAYRPMALGPVGRNAAERVKLAGTYDDEWLEKTFPFLPKDFRLAYHQAAAPDQQIPFPRGGETVVLQSLTREGRRAFRLPTMQIPILFVREKHGDVQGQMALDTVAIDGEAEKLSITWRFSVPLKRNMFEVSTVVVGTPTPGWVRARRTGKVYYRSLGAYVRAKAAGGGLAQEAEDQGPVAAIGESEP
jgi:hypothetical protein